MKIIKMADEAFASGVMPKGYSVIAGYLKSPTAFHVWTKADWAKFDGFKKLPIYVSPTLKSGIDVTPVADAFDCLRMLLELGVPVGTAIALDMETQVNTHYVSSFCEVLNYFGYAVWVYGSASTVFGNPAPRLGGYWVADYAGKGPFMYSHKGVKATQYADGKTYDSSDVKPWQYWHRLKKW